MQTHPGEGEEVGKVTWDLQGRRTNSAVGEDITRGEIFEIKLDRQTKEIPSWRRIGVRGGALTPKYSLEFI